MKDDDAHVSAMRERRFARRCAALGLAIVLLSAALFLAVRPYSVPGPPMGDLEAYYAAGATWLAGGDPYSMQIWAAERALPGVNAHHDEVLPFLGPPLSLPFFAALSRLSYYGAVVVWGGILALAVLAIFWGAFVLAGRPLRRFDVVIVVALAAAFGPLSNGFSLGQTVLAAMGMLTVALCSARGGRWAAAGLGSLAIVVLKPNVSLALIGLSRSRRGFVALVAAGAAFVVGSVLVAGPRGIARYASVLHGQTAAERASMLQMTPTSIALGFGAAPEVADVLGSLIAIAAIIALGVVVWRIRADEIETAALACAALPFVSPFLHEHDLIVTFLPAMLCLHRAKGRTWSAGALGTVLIANDWLALTQGFLGGVYAVVTALVASLEVAALADRVPIRLRAIPFAVVPLAAVLWLAAPHAATPLWPSALPAGFKAAPGASVTEVWGDEQRASGLERVFPYAATVRLFSLIGCGLVFGALAATVGARPGIPSAPAAPGSRGPLSEVAAQRRPQRRQRKPRVAAHVDG